MITSSPCFQFARRYAVLGGELQRVDDAQHLVEATPGGHAADHQLDLLVGPDDEHRAHGHVVHTSGCPRSPDSAGSMPKAFEIDRSVSPIIG